MFSCYGYVLLIFSALNSTDGKIIRRLLKRLFEKLLFRNITMMLSGSDIARTGSCNHDAND